MGLLDDIQNQASSALGGSGDSGLGHGILEMLTSQQSGGLAGLAQMFVQQGLGHVVSSWISTGQNLPISSSQLQSVLGNPLIQQIAARAGLSPEAAISKLSAYLPQFVDKLTPTGEIREGNLLEKGLSLLKGS